MKSPRQRLAAILYRSLKPAVVVLSMFAVLPGAAFANAAPVQSPGNTPSGLDFYTPPSPLPPGRHGDLLRARNLEEGAALPHAGRNWLVLYRSTDISGRPIAVSGTLAIPDGTPPAGGWPVISWTHGTTGTADICAPSRDGANYPDKEYVERMNKTLDQWLQQGYAVVKTDYQGLGTPGPHPYLIGNSEARNAADMVLAAQQVTDQLSNDWLVMGHSQGGQAAIFTAGMGSVYAQRLHLTGAVAISPASHLEDIMGYFRANPKKSASPFLPILLQGAAAASSSVKPIDLLTPTGQKQLKLADERCIGGLRKPDAMGKLKTNQVLRQDANYQPLNDVFDDLEGSEHVYPTVPLLVLQATNDRIVPKVLTEQTVTELCNLGAPVTYRSYTVKDRNGTAAAHRGTVEISRDDAMKWVAARFAGETPSSNCSTSNAHSN